MKQLFITALMSFLTLSLTYAASSDGVIFEENNRRIVVLKKEQKANTVASEISQRYGVPVGHVYSHVLKGFSISLPDVAVKKLEQDQRIRYIANDGRVKAVSTPTGVKRVAADKNGTSDIGADGGSVDIDVAVIDTGIDLDHPKLNVYKSANFSKETSADDGNGHGSHVAGTIAGIDDGSGTVGVAPGARLWGVKVLNDRGSGWIADIVAGLDYVAANADQIEVANMSLGGAGSDDGNCGLTNSDPMHEAVCSVVNAGVVLVVAAGNSNEDAKYSVPASYDEVITVSAIGDTDGQPGGLGPNTSRNTADDTLADFSNFGEDVDIAAPGVDIYSTYKDGGTHTYSGTSMASPHVAGAVALYIVKNGRAYDAGGVLAIKDGVIAFADEQDSARGFTGDSDGFKEPLLNVENIDPIDPVPGVVNIVSTDKSSYNTEQGDSVAVVTSLVRDEYGNPISGLSSDAFTSSLDGLSIALTFSESETPGTYHANLDVTTLNDGEHLLSVNAYDGDRDLSGNGSKSFKKSSNSEPKIFVSDISYRTSGCIFRNRDLIVTVTIGDTDNEVVAAAAVTLELYRNEAYVGSATGTTRSDGKVEFKLKKAPKGYYTSEIVDVVLSGREYDSSLNVADPGYQK